jgi:hypothetical protein
VKRFDVHLEGQTRANVGEEEIKPLFRDGRIGRETPCRISGTRDWRTVEDVLPLLKYEFSMPVRVPVPMSGPPIPSAVQDSPVGWIDHDDEGRRALTTSLKAGWICFGLGAAVAWIFFPGYFFYSVALVMAVIAMCTRQVSRGLILLLSTFVAMGTSALISIFLMGTLFVGAFGAAAAKAERDREAASAEMREAQTRLNDALDRTLTKLPTTTPEPPVEQWSAKETLDEIARVEQRHRFIRRQGRDVSSSDIQYLNRLRSAHDKALQQ